MRLLLTLCAAAVSGLGTPASAQRYWGPDQLPYSAPDTPTDTCATRTLALLLGKLQLPEAETLAGEGVTGVRVFQYDAFGTIWPATALLTHPIDAHRREGTAEAVTVQADGRLATLKRPIWEGGWREMDAVIEAILADPPVAREAAPRPPGRNGPIPPTCLDAPTVIIEVIRAGEVQRWVPDTCRQQAAIEAAHRIPEIIAAAFPVCGHFPIERYGRGSGRVRACLGVEGEDPISAVEVMEILRPNVGGDTQVIFEVEHQSATVSLLGIDDQRVQGRAAVLAALQGGALGQRWLRVVQATGNDAGVVVTAELRQTGDLDHPDPLPLQMRWVREADGVWRITDWSVQPR